MVEPLNNFNYSELKIDQSFLKVTSDYPSSLWMYELSSDCYKCPYEKLRKINQHSTHVMKVDTGYDLSWKFFDKDQGNFVLKDVNPHCTVDPSLGEHGAYHLNINETSCDITILKDPANSYLPLVLPFVLWILLVAFHFIKKWYKKCKRNDNESNDVVEETKPNIRLKSLDTFRGISITLMIFVNSGGGGYKWIEHATWNGLHVADLVFPWFLWIMGVCIPISIKSQLRKGITKKSLLLNVVRRSVTLFIYGVCLNTVSGGQIEDLRIFGVLQRFGISYLIVATLHILMTDTIEFPPLTPLRQSLLDILILWKEWIVMFIFVTIHLALIFLLPVPNCPKGYLGPGGKHDMNQYIHCIGGVTGYVDRLILGVKHIYQHPTARYIYNSEAFDPEGVFGCILTIFHTFIGLQCGTTLIVFTDWKSRVKRWLIWGILLGLIGAGLCNFSQENGLIPLNKNLWSLSFVLITSCFSFFLLSWLYYIIDVKKLWSGSPFYYSGMNAMVMYIGHTITHKMLPWHWRIGLMNKHLVLLTESLWNTSLWMAIAYYLYIKNIFYTV